MNEPKVSNIGGTNSLNDSWSDILNLLFYVMAS